LQTIQNNLATVSTNLINGINDQAGTSIYKTIQTINSAQASLTTQITAGFSGVSAAISAISTNSQGGTGSNDLSGINNSLTQMNTVIQAMNQQLQSLQVVVQNIASSQGISTTPATPASWWQTIINSPWVVITICAVLLMIVRRITSTESY
jgi:hypothetical protein